MDGSAVNIEEITQRLQRDVNCLTDDNRTTRRRALDRLRKETVDHRPPHPPAALQGLLDFALKPLLRVLSDPTEKCRELAVSLLADFSLAVEDVTLFLPLLVPVLVARLGTQEITEPSEELRLSLVTLLSSLIELEGTRMAPYLSDLVTILQRTIVDPYPEVKKESCRCSELFARAIPATFSQQSESVAKPLLLSMSHQHSKVRTASLKAFGTTVRYGSATPITDALPVLAQRACDSAPSVRSCLIDITGEWLLDLPDRYSYHHKLLPLLLTGLTDELPEIRRKAHALWEQVGKKYEIENEDELKDKLDFVKMVEPAPHLEFLRPGLGCRVLVYRNFSKVLPAILRDIVDWTTNSRIKSSQLLFTLLCHLEEQATHHIQAVMGGLYRAAQDDEATVLEMAVMSGEVIGYYVPPEVWCQLVLPAVRTSAGCHVSGTPHASTVPVGPVQCTSCLTVLAALVRGAPRKALQPQLQNIAACLAEPEVSQSEHTPLLHRLVACVVAVVTASGTPSSQLSFCLFSVLLRVASSQHLPELSEEVDACLQQLSSSQGMESTLGLYQAHAQDILTIMKVGYPSWTVHSPDCALFGSLLSGAGPVIGQLLDDVIPILSSCLRPESDPEMRLHFITLLIRLLLDAPNTLDSQQCFAPFAGRVVTDIAVPNLVWRAGRTAAAIRTAGMTCLQALLQGKLLSADQLDRLMDTLLPQVVSCLDDDNSSTRLVSCKVLQLMFLEKPAALDVDKLHTLYTDLLKRLDDSNDDIRMAIAATLTAYANCFPDNYAQGLYQAHIEALFKGLLVHLDDPASDVQDAVLVILKQAARLNPTTLRQQTEAVKHKHRTTKYCDAIITFLEDSA